MDTLSNVIDKMFTTNLKLWYNKNNPDISKVKNLAGQRKSLVSETDDLFDKVMNHKIDDSDALRPQHKTY